MAQAVAGGAGATPNDSVERSRSCSLTHDLNDEAVSCRSVSVGSLAAPGGIGMTFTGFDGGNTVTTTAGAARTAAATTPDDWCVAEELRLELPVPLRTSSPRLWTAESPISMITPDAHEGHAERRADEDAVLIVADDDDDEADGEAEDTGGGEKEAKGGMRRGRHAAHHTDGDEGGARHNRRRSGSGSEGRFQPLSRATDSTATTQPLLEVPEGAYVVGRYVQGADSPWRSPILRGVPNDAAYPGELRGSSVLEVLTRSALLDAAAEKGAPSCAQRTLPPPRLASTAAASSRTAAARSSSAEEEELPSSPEHIRRRRCDAGGGTAAMACGSGQDGDGAGPPAWIHGGVGSCAGAPTAAVVTPTASPPSPPQRPRRRYGTDSAAAVTRSATYSSPSAVGGHAALPGGAPLASSEPGEGAPDVVHAPNNGIFFTYCASDEPYDGHDAERGRPNSRYRHNKSSTFDNSLPQHSARRNRAARGMRDSHPSRVASCRRYVSASPSSGSDGNGGCPPDPLLDRVANDGANSDMATVAAVPAALAAVCSRSSSSSRSRVTQGERRPSPQNAPAGSCSSPSRQARGSSRHCHSSSSNWKFAGAVAIGGDGGLHSERASPARRVEASSKGPPQLRGWRERPDGLDAAEGERCGLAAAKTAPHEHSLSSRRHSTTSSSWEPLISVNPNLLHRWNTELNVTVGRISSERAAAATGSVAGPPFIYGRSGVLDGELSTSALGYRHASLESSMSRHVGEDDGGITATLHPPKHVHKIRGLRPGLLNLEGSLLSCVESPVVGLQHCRRLAPRSSAGGDHEAAYCGSSTHHRHPPSREQSPPPVGRSHEALGSSDVAGVSQEQRRSETLRLVREQLQQGGSQSPARSSLARHALAVPGASRARSDHGRCSLSPPSPACDGRFPGHGFFSFPCESHLPGAVGPLPALGSPVSDRSVSGGPARNLRRHAKVVNGFVGARHQRMCSVRVLSITPSLLRKAWARRNLLHRQSPDAAKDGEVAIAIDEQFLTALTNATLRLLFADSAQQSDLGQWAAWAMPASVMHAGNPVTWPSGEPQTSPYLAHHQHELLSPTGFRVDVPWKSTAPKVVYGLPADTSVESGSNTTTVVSIDTTHVPSGVNPTAHASGTSSPFPDLSASAFSSRQVSMFALGRCREQGAKAPWSRQAPARGSAVASPTCPHPCPGLQGMLNAEGSPTGHSCAGGADLPSQRPGGRGALTLPVIGVECSAIAKPYRVPRRVQRRRTECGGAQSAAMYSRRAWDGSVYSEPIERRAPASVQSGGDGNRSGTYEVGAIMVLTDREEDEEEEEEEEDGDDHDDEVDDVGMVNETDVPAGLLPGKGDVIITRRYRHAGDGAKRRRHHSSATKHRPSHRVTPTRSMSAVSKRSTPNKATPSRKTNASKGAKAASKTSTTAAVAAGGAEEAELLSYCGGAKPRGDPTADAPGVGVVPLEPSVQHISSTRVVLTRAFCKRSNRDQSDSRRDLRSTSPAVVASRRTGTSRSNSNGATADSQPGEEPEISVSSGTSSCFYDANGVEDRAVATMGIAFPFITQGNVGDVYREWIAQAKPSFAEREVVIRNVLFAVLLQLQAMHRHGRAHGSIKATNIFLKSHVMDAISMLTQANADRGGRGAGDATSTPTAAAATSISPASASLSASSSRANNVSTGPAAGGRNVNGSLAERQAGGEAEGLPLRTPGLSELDDVSYPDEAGPVPGGEASKVALSAGTSARPTPKKSTPAAGVDSMTRRMLEDSHEVVLADDFYSCVEQAIIETVGLMGTAVEAADATGCAQPGGERRSSPLLRRDGQLQLLLSDPTPTKEAGTGEISGAQGVEPHRQAFLELFTIEEAEYIPPPECITSSLHMTMRRHEDSRTAAAAAAGAGPRSRGILTCDGQRGPSPTVTPGATAAFPTTTDPIARNTYNPRTALTQAYDVWMVGVLAIHLAEGVFPAFLKLQHNPMPSLRRGQWSRKFLSFVQSCVALEAHARPTVDQLLQDPWFQSVILEPVNGSADGCFVVAVTAATADGGSLASARYSGNCTGPGRMPTGRGEATTSPALSPFVSPPRDSARWARYAATAAALSSPTAPFPLKHLLGYQYNTKSSSIVSSHRRGDRAVTASTGAPLLSPLATSPPEDGDLVTNDDRGEPGGRGSCRGGVEADALARVALRAMSSPLLVKRASAHAAVSAATKVAGQLGHRYRGAVDYQGRKAIIAAVVEAASGFGSPPPMYRSHIDLLTELVGDVQKWEVARQAVPRSSRGGGTATAVAELASPPVPPSLPRGVSRISQPLEAVPNADDSRRVDAGGGATSTSPTRQSGHDGGNERLLAGRGGALQEAATATRSGEEDPGKAAGRVVSRRKIRRSRSSRLSASGPGGAVPRGGKALRVPPSTRASARLRMPSRPSWRRAVSMQVPGALHQRLASTPATTALATSSPIDAKGGNRCSSGGGGGGGGGGDSRSAGSQRATTPSAERGQRRRTDAGDGTRPAITPGPRDGSRSSSSTSSRSQRLALSPRGSASSTSSSSSSSASSRATSQLSSLATSSTTPTQPGLSSRRSAAGGSPGLKSHGMGAELARYGGVDGSGGGSSPSAFPAFLGAFCAAIASVGSSRSSAAKLEKRSIRPTAAARSGGRHNGCRTSSSGSSESGGSSSSRGHCSSSSSSSSSDDDEEQLLLEDVLQSFMNLRLASRVSADLLCVHLLQAMARDGRTSSYVAPLTQALREESVAAAAAAVTPPGASRALGSTSNGAVGTPDESAARMSAAAAPSYGAGAASGGSPPPKWEKGDNTLWGPLDPVLSREESRDVCRAPSGSSATGDAPHTAVVEDVSPSAFHSYLFCKWHVAASNSLQQVLMTERR